MLLAIAVSGYAEAQQAQWQEVKHATAIDGDIDIFGKDGMIVIRTNRRIQVRVFTILGQLVSQATLPAGESALKVNSRGIYIVKVENRTQKVAL
ncbi:MAG: T9SS type A sorting domain-containing protein [Muribaculaceae bacterium]